MELVIVGPTALASSIQAALKVIVPTADTEEDLLPPVVSSRDDVGRIVVVRMPGGFPGTDHMYKFRNGLQRGVNFHSEVCV